MPNRIFYDLMLIKMSLQSHQTSANTTNVFLKTIQHMYTATKAPDTSTAARSCRRTEIASAILRARTPLLNASSEVFSISHPTTSETNKFFLAKQIFGCYSSLNRERTA